jgi:group I intron endonuclease
MKVVYKAMFPNGKVYIGKSKNFENRKMSHFYNSTYENYNSTKMKRAINKYGFDNIIWDILFESDDIDIINEKEKQYIILFDSIKNGYNISNGGDGGDTISNNERKNDIIKQQLKSKGIDPDKYVIITDELKNDIIDDYVNNKLSRNALVKKYSISKQRMSRLLKSEKIEIDMNKGSEINTKTFSIEYIDKIIELYNSGLNIKTIGEQENLTIMMVSRILHDSGTRISIRFKDGKRYDSRQPKNKLSYD